MGSGLRKGWKTHKLGEVCKISIGKTPARGNKKFWDTEKETNNIWLSIRDLNNTQGKEIFDSREYISESGAKLFNFVKKGTLLVSFKLTLGRLAFAGSDLYTNEAIASLKITNNEKLNNEYLYYYLTFFDWEAETKGEVKVKGKTLNKAKLKEIKVFIPTLQEQKKIVAILDEAFSAIEKVKTNTELNLQNTKEVFENYLQNIFENKGKNWEENTLGEITTVKSGGTPSRSKKEYWEGNIAWYSSGELNELFTKKPERYINDLAIKNSSTKLFPIGSLLIGMYDTAALKMSIIDRDATFNQAIAGVEPNANINLIFILHSINSIKSEILNLRRGVRQKNLNLSKIKNIPIFLPPISKQITIVKKLNALSKQTKKLESIYQQKLQDLDELKKSILQKAFNGELVLNTELNKAIPFPIKISGISSTDLHIGIIGIAYQKHEEFENLNTFGHVKVEKISHLIEYFIGIDLDRDAVKDAAGPNDFKHLKKVEHRAKKAGFFNVVKQDDGYHYQPKKSFDKIIEKTKQKLSSTQLDKINNLLNIMVKMNTKQAEVFATVFAAWNNLLIKKIDITDEKIVYEARENWHKDKLNISRDKFFIAIDWMKRNSFIPKGRGKLIVDKSFNKRS